MHSRISVFSIAGRLTPAVFVAAMLWSSCAPAGPPRTYRFTSNRDSAAALRCAADRLRIDDFLLEEDSTRAGPVVALRRMESTDEVGMPEWWRVQVNITRDIDGRTVVESLAGVAPTPQGPYREPDVDLQSIIGRISASCTW